MDLVGPGSGETVWPWVGGQLPSLSWMSVWMGLGVLGRQGKGRKEPGAWLLLSTLHL